MTAKERDELLIRIDERVNSLLVMKEDVDDLKVWRNKLKGAWLAIVGVAGAAGTVASILFSYFNN